MLSIFPSNIKAVDIAFLISVLVIIGICVALYFLIPVLNQKKYQQQREALKKREQVFIANQEAKKKDLNE